MKNTPTPETPSASNSGAFKSGVEHPCYGKRAWNAKGGWIMAMRSDALALNPLAMIAVPVV